MKKLSCIFLLIAILFTGCQAQPVDNPAEESSTPSAVTEETPGRHTLEPSGENASQTPSASVAPTPSSTSSTATSGGTSTPIATASATAEKTNKPTATPIKTSQSTAVPTATVAPKIKTFSIPVSVAGGVKADVEKVNFKGYYKNNDENSGIIIVSQDATNSFTLTGNTDWTLSSEYSTYPKSLMSVPNGRASKKTVTVTFKAGATVSAEDIRAAHFVYVPNGNGNDVVNNGIPTMLINVNSQTDYNNLIHSTDTSVKDIWSEATYAVVEGTAKTYNTKDAQGTLKIKRRGFSSFSTFDKKSYTVKLSDGVELLGMESNKDWVLVANHSDKSLLRNYFAYTLGQKMNTMWVPDCNFIDVYITWGSTSNYLGTYLLVEKIEVAKEKINIQEMTEADTDIGSVGNNTPMERTLAGSFLVELESFDRASTGDMLIQTEKYQLSVKSPDKDYFAPSTWFDPTRQRTWPDTHLATKNTKQAEYIRTFFNVTTDAIRTENYATFSRYIDIDSFVDYYIINELAKNIDGNFRLSTYFYKDKGGKLKVTIWDFDIAFGNCDYDFEGVFCGTTDGLYIREKTSWYRHLFQSPEFCDKVKTRWNTLRKGILSDSNMASLIRNQAKAVENAAEDNFDRWPILGTYVWPNSREIVNCKTYDANVEQLVSWVQRRAAWLDDNI